jgi:hypothetical protein
MSLYSYGKLKVETDILCLIVSLCCKFSFATLKSWGFKMESRIPDSILCLRHSVVRNWGKIYRKFRILISSRKGLSR